MDNGTNNQYLITESIRNCDKKMHSKNKECFLETS